MKRDGNTILITGGGSGIGRALAHRWHDQGNHVIVAGRRRDALEETVAGRARMSLVALDVGDAAAIAETVPQILASYPALNVLVNNAGIMRPETLSAARDLADSEATIETNLLGPIRLTNALIDHLAAQPDAAILAMTSGLAFVPLVMTPTYSATKAALHSYLISLRMQLQGQVEVIEIAPPGVQTELTPGQSHREGFQSLESFADEVMGLLAGQPTPPEICVQQVQMFRNAEAEGRFDHVLRLINSR